MINESRLDNKLPKISNTAYNLFTSNLNQEKAQGTLTIIKKDIHTILEEKIINKNITITKIIIEKSLHLIIINVYIPPNGNEHRNKTISDLETYLDTIHKLINNP